MPEVLSEEAMAAMMEEMDKAGNEEAPTASEPESESTPSESAAEKVVYEEDPPEAPAEAPTESQEEQPLVFRAKVQGEEIEIPVVKDGKINPLLLERFQMGEDYYRKTEALAAERRMWQEETLKRMAGQKPDQKEDKEDDGLPDDDPYTQQIRTGRKTIEQLRQENQSLQEGLKRLEQEIASDRNERFLAKEEERLKGKYEHMTPYDLSSIEKAWLGEYERGNVLTLDAVAEAHFAHMAKIKAAAVEEWKSKHRVTGKKEESRAAGGPAPPRKLSFEDDSLHSAVLEQLTAKDW